MLSEISQRKTNSVGHHLYVESKKYNKLVNLTKKKQIYRYGEQLAVTRGERENTGEHRCSVQQVMPTSAKSLSSRHAYTVVSIDSIRPSNHTTADNFIS